MDYPSNFPEHLKRPVDTTIANAEADFVEARQKLRQSHTTDELESIAEDFIRTVMFSFGKQVCEAVKEGTWNGETARSYMESFLHTVTLQTYFHKCRTRSYSDGPGRFEDEIKQRLRASAQWVKYQRTLAAALNSHRATVAEIPQPNKPNARQAFVLPILREKGMTRSKWASAAGVDPAVVYDYLKGDSRPRPDSRKALAQAIGVKESDLPQ